MHWGRVNAGVDVSSAELRAADASADRALELDGRLSVALLAKGLVAYTEGRLEDMARYCGRAAEVDANSDALGFLAYAHALAGRAETARACADRAIASDPLNSWALFFRAYMEMLCGELPDAIEQFRHAVALAPEDPMLVAFYGLALAHGERTDDARTQFECVRDRWPGVFDGLTQIWLSALAGDREGVRRAAIALEDFARRDKEIAWNLADCLSAVGQNDEALGWLEIAIDLGFVNTRFLSTSDPFLSRLNGTPRFQGLMEKARERQRVLEAALTRVAAP